MKKILLVEDDQFLSQMYTEILSGEDFQIEKAFDGDEALSKIQNGTWDLILLDVLMPKKTGIEVIEFLQLHNPSILKQNILFLTNTDSGTDINQITKLGYKYLTKADLNPEEFLKIIKQALEAGR